MKNNNLSDFFSKVTPASSTPVLEEVLVNKEVKSLSTISIPDFANLSKIMLTDEVEKLIRDSIYYAKTKQKNRSLELILNDIIDKKFSFDYCQNRNGVKNKQISNVKFTTKHESFLTEIFKQQILNKNIFSDYINELVKSFLTGKNDKLVKVKVGDDEVICKALKLLTCCLCENELELTKSVKINTAQVKRLKEGKLGLTAKVNFVTKLNEFSEQLDIDIHNKLVTLNLPDTPKRVLDYGEFMNFKPDSTRVVYKK
ncbi:hypothetical protein [Vibrio harveyi]|uniref:hypothetical protein n=1 Tax=Vibrio harveyi TaxID=669 RepID=UPI0002C49398|nr:hypothetical protein [Vibrio harveyi]EMR36801.1 hypothetical protein MUQ_11444 [Vibrio harveyi CAIM 1792]